MPLDAFSLYLESARQLEAQRRLEYLSDTMVAIGAAFSGGNTVKDYIADLERAYLGER